MAIDANAVGIDPSERHHFAADRFLHALSFSVEGSDKSSAFLEIQGDSLHVASSLLVVPNLYQQGDHFCSPFLTPRFRLWSEVDGSNQSSATTKEPGAGPVLQ